MLITLFDVDKNLSWIFTFIEKLHICGKYAYRDINHDPFVL